MTALDRPRRGPSRPRDAGKRLDRLRARRGTTGKGATASYFATSGAAHHAPTAALASPMDRELKCALSGRTGTSGCRGSRRERTVVRLRSAKRVVFTQVGQHDIVHIDASRGWLAQRSKNTLAKKGAWSAWSAQTLLPL